MNMDIKDLTKNKPEEIITLNATRYNKLFWNEWKLNPADIRYNIHFAYTIKGEFHKRRFINSIKNLVKLNTSFKISFRSLNYENTDICQDINHKYKYEPEFMDLSEVHDGENYCKKLIQNEVSIPFNLSKPPLFKFIIYKITPDIHVFLFLGHHIVLDGLCINKMLNDLETYYNSPSDDCQYDDLDTYIKFSKRDSESNEEVIAKNLEYWNKEINQSSLNLPITLKNNNNGTVKNADEIDYFTFKIDKYISSMLYKFSIDNNLLPSHLFISIWSIFLSKYTDKKDIPLSFPLNDRFKIKNELIASSINTLPLIINVCDNDDIVSIAKKTSAKIFSLLRYSNVMLSDIVSSVKYRNNGFDGSVLNVGIVETESRERGLNLNGVSEVIPFFFDNIGNCELNLEYYLDNNDIKCQINYINTLFTKEEIINFYKRLEILIEKILSNSKQSISTFNILSEKEYNEVIYDFNLTDSFYPKRKTIHELFEENAILLEDKVAVISNNMELTYKELNEKSNQLAKYIQKEFKKITNQDLDSNNIVALCLERSNEMIIAILAVLKAGGCYLPVDPDYPPERINYTLKDSEAEIIISQTHLKNKLKDIFENNTLLNTLFIDSDETNQILEMIPRDNVKLTSSANDLAYVIYTSGSTGNPKGVMCTHKGLCNRLHWMKEKYSFNSEDIILQKTSYSFDVSVWELLLPLISGSTLVFAKPGGQKDSLYLAQLINEMKITTIHFVPSMLNVFLEQGNLKYNCKSLKRVFCSGEALSFDLQQKYHKKLSASLFNLYGPTEASIDVTYWNCNNDQSINIVPIGKPISNMKTYILDSSLQPVPIGMIGELYLSGVGLAKGYLNKEELTNDKFIHNPFDHSFNKKMYKTGDLARYLVDGNIEFKGRIDDQVKIRGFRIELDEIKHYLLKHELIDDCIIQSHKINETDGNLTAYIVNNDNINISQIRDHLKTSLPDYMIPNKFIFIDNIPLLPNGKIDKKSLPHIHFSRSMASHEYVSPKSENEIIIARIWENVLSIDKVGIHDDFFELGGDSIKGIQVLGLAQKENIDISIQDFYQHKTIYDIAKNSKEIDVNTSRHNYSKFSLISDKDKLKIPDGVEDAYPTSAIQTGMIYHTELDQDSYYYQVAFTFHLKAPFDKNIFCESIQSISRHPMCRTYFDLNNYSEPLQIIQKNAQIPFEITNLRMLSLEEQEKVIDDKLELEKHREYNWSSAPLLFFHVYLRTEETFQFNVSFHVSIFDGWSAASMFTEIFNKYFSLIFNKDSYCPTLPEVSYANFVFLEKQAIKDFNMKRFWERQLVNSEVTSLPKNVKNSLRSKIQESTDIAFHVPSNILQRLLVLSKCQSDSLKHLLLAAHLKVMSIFKNSSNITTGVVCNGRLEDDGGEKVFANHLNTLPFCIDLSNCSWIELIGLVFDKEREIQPNRRYPMAQIQKDRGGLAAYDNAFNFTHFHVYEIFDIDNSLQFLGGQFTDPFHYHITANCRLDVDQSNLDIVLNYTENIISKEQINTIGKTYINVLSTIVDYPNEPHDKRILWPKSELDLVVNDRNVKKCSYPSTKTVVELIEEQVDLNKKSIAVKYNNSSMTYEDLEIKSNQIATYLRDQGVKCNTPVGILAERSLNLIVIILGILKAGAAYVPLDPSYPKDRLNYILDDTNIDILIAQNNLLDCVSKKKHLNICIFNEKLDNFSNFNSKRITISDVRSDDLAYIIYTSGSTGKPKGVMCTHQGLSNRLLWMKNQYNFTNNDRILQKTAYSFDVSVWELILPLMSGATLIFAKPQGHKDSKYIAGIINEEKITTIHFVPSMLNVFLEEENLKSNCKSLKRVFCSGEALTYSLQQKYFSRLDIPLYNLYGPTEASIDVTHWTCTKDNCFDLVPIGKPISNMKTYILNNNMQPVPIGVQGELYLSGIGLAKGYLNRSELTNERFIDNPFGNSIYSKLYKTGDLARYLSDGDIEYIGRNDNQVKIRGYRIELGEIESVLLENINIINAVVLTKENDKGTIHIVAYVLLRINVTVNQLKDTLRQQLPDYMIPNSILLLDEFPYLPNGKIDHRSLLELKHSQPELLLEYVAPQTVFEKILVNIWEELLNVNKIGVYDNFFDLGGDSIICLQMVHQLKQVGYSITLMAVNTNPYIKKLSELAIENDPKVAVIDEKEELSNDLMPLDTIQNWFFEKNLPNPHKWNSSFLLEYLSPIKFDDFKIAILATIKHHDSLRLLFSKKDGTWKQYYSSFDDEVIEKSIIKVDLSDKINKEINKSIHTFAKDIQGTFNISKSLSCKFVYFELGKELQPKVLVVFHHLLIDAVSIRHILLPDISQACLQCINKEVVDLPKTTTPLKKWLERNYDFSQSKPITDEFKFWKSKIPITIKDFPKDYIEGDNIEKYCNISVVSITQEETSILLKKLSSHYQTSTIKLLITAYLYAFLSWEEFDYILTDVTDHGRSQLFGDIDVSRTTGWLSSFYPVCIQFKKQDNIFDLLELVSKYLDNLPNYGLGYGMLRYSTQETCVKEKMIDQPKASINFNYIGQMDQSLSSSNLNDMFKVSKTYGFNITHGRNGTLGYLIDNLSSITNGRLTSWWYYSSKIYKEKTITNLSKKYIENIRLFIKDYES